MLQQAATSLRHTAPFYSRNVAVVDPFALKKTKNMLNRIAEDGNRYLNKESDSFANQGAVSFSKLFRGIILKMSSA